MILVEFTLEGIITKISPLLTNMLGYTDQELLGHHQGLLGDVNYKKSTKYQNFWQKVRSGLATDDEYRVMKKDGSPMYLRGEFKIIYDRTTQPATPLRILFEDQQPAQQLYSSTQVQLQRIISLPNTTNGNHIDASNFLTVGNSADDALRHLCSIMPAAWQYPEFAVARIIFDGIEFLSSENQTDNNTKYVLSQSFQTIDGKKGAIEIFYLKDFPLSDEGPYLASERQLLNNLANLICGFLNIIKSLDRESNTNENIQKLLHEKRERNKELTCINKTTQIIKQGSSVESTLLQIVSILPEAWQYPENTCARITFDGQSFIFPENKFEETLWVLSKSFKTVQNHKGAIEVFYLQEFTPSDEGPFMREERDLIDNLAILITGFLNLIEKDEVVSTAQAGLQKLQAENTERIKELTCINQTNRIIKEGFGIDDTLQQICYLLPGAWQYPEHTSARIIFNNEPYSTYKFTETKWLLRSNFETFDDTKGAIEIFYHKQFPNFDEGPFLKEEHHLIDNLATILTSYLNSVKSIEFLKKFRQQNSEKTVEATVNQINSRQLLQNFLNKHNTNRDIYHDLMPFKVKEILLIATLYDAFYLEKEGRFTEHIFGEYHKLNLTSIPRVTGASTLEEANELLKEKHFDLVILMKGGSWKTAKDISVEIKKNFRDLPIFLLLNNFADTKYFKNDKTIDRMFIWNGDSRLFFAMVKLLEDSVNVKVDTRIGLVKVILLVEDSERYYSRYLPMLYDHVMDQTMRMIEDVKADELYKVLRLRARPKILLTSDYESAVEIIQRYRENILCLITDVKYPRAGKTDEHAGFKLVEHSRELINELPIIVQSSDKENGERTWQLKATFINKNSQSQLADIEDFFGRYLGFGNFNFRNSDGVKIATAKTLDEFEKILENVPFDSLFFHGHRNHFSLWLMARGEIRIAKMINPVKVNDFNSADEFRKYLQYVLKQYRHEERLGSVVHFQESALGDETNIVSLSSGALGGKGRGVAFINQLIYNVNFNEIVSGIRIRSPRTSIIGTDEFDYFMDTNELRTWITQEDDFQKIRERFLLSRLSFGLTNRLKQLLKIFTRPIAVRSSSLFEDSSNQPFSGIFETYLLPNNHPDFRIRLEQTLNAIKLVYSSIYSTNARTYFAAVNYPIEDEKMAIVLQEVVGNTYESVYYPHISGTAQSHNYYPIAHMEPEDGVAVAAVGLGQYVVEGEKAYRFSPKYPTLEINSTKDLLKSSQVHFYAVNLANEEVNLLEGEDAGLIKLDISTAEKHGTIKHSASVYDPYNDRIEPGLSAAGPRIINFANILKYEYIPLAKTVEIILDVVKEAMGTPVEIEFAIDLNRDKKGDVSFYLLQIKPLVGNEEDYTIEPEKIVKEKILLFTERSMGNGKIDEIYDVIYVDKGKFDKMRTLEMVNEIERLNAKMMKQNKQYVLIGPGRWGTRDKFIGIPVAWPQISNAKVIVEMSLEDFPLDASLGSHFFHNVTSMQVGYFSIQTDTSGYVVWDLLEKQELLEQTEFFRHVRFANPLTITMDGRKQLAVIEV